MRLTAKCVYCGREAETWTGHVITEQGKHVIAGWCKRHSKVPDGFFGHYRKWMGKQERP